MSKFKAGDQVTTCAVNLIKAYDAPPNIGDHVTCKWHVDTCHIVYVIAAAAPGKVAITTLIKLKYTEILPNQMISEDWFKLYKSEELLIQSRLNLIAENL